MAKAYFYIIPSADISVEHELVPADSPNAYSLINDVDSFDDTTSLKLTGVAGETITCTSSFRMSGVKPLDARCILSVEVYVSSSGGEISITATVDGKVFELEQLSDKFGYYTNQSFTDTIKQYDVLPEIIITLTSSVTTAAGAKLPSYQYVRKMCIEVAYSNGIHRKVNNEWKHSVAVYQKINGIWEQIENGYETVGSRLSTKGHHQLLLQGTKPNCTETGITEGYKCSICGETFIPQTVIPANGHNYIASGGKQVCTVCNYVEGLGFTELVSSGTATALKNAQGYLAATTVGNYALFGGGYTDGAVVSDVSAYDTSLTMTTATGLSVARSNLAATTVGNYALFGGGSRKSSIGVATVDAYDTSLTMTTATGLSVARSNLAATTVGNYALFAGNANGIAEAYDTSLTMTTTTGLSDSRSDLSATTVGNYALFGGGFTINHGSDIVDAYDTSLTRTTATELFNLKGYLAATTVGNYALFGGGYTGGAVVSDVSAYDTSLTMTTATSLSSSRYNLSATTVGNYALFGGGYDGNDVVATVDTYGTSLTMTTATGLSVARMNLAATTVGNYALFGGGYDNSSTRIYYSTVDAYKLQPISQ